MACPLQLIASALANEYEWQMEYKEEWNGIRMESNCN
jgi:hypothetical protein